MPFRRHGTDRVRTVGNGRPAPTTPTPYDRHGGGGPDLAWSATCHICGKTAISVIRRFPQPWVCMDCDPRRNDTKRWLADHPRCSKGHLLTEATIAVRPNGARVCRMCVRESHRKKQASDGGFEPPLGDDPHE